MLWGERLKRQIKLRDLHVLETAAQAGSLTKAAKALGMSQPAVSYTIAEMEKLLGVPLLDRTPQGVSPTTFGRVLLDRSIVAFNEIRRGITELEALADPEAGELRIGTPQPMLSVTRVVIDEMSKLYPRVSFHLSVESTHVLLRELRHRSIELVISRMMLPFVDDDLKIDVLFNDQLAVVAGAGNPLHRRTSIKLAQLISEPWVFPSPEGWLYPLVQNAFASNGLPVPRATVSTLSTYAVSMLVANGRFLTIHPETMLRVANDHPRLKALPISLSSTRTPVAMIGLKGHSLSPVAERFAEATRSVVSKMFAQPRARKRQ
jgi:DNA-binding transcriptional LysR family regulator